MLATTLVLKLGVPAQVQNLALGHPNTHLTNNEQVL
jgi:hypothetical protein